jgi:flagellar basal body-associated protein FliL
MVRNSKTIIIALVIVTVTVAGGLFWKLNSVGAISPSEEYKQRIRNALSEINLSNDQTLVSANSSSASLSDFIYYRSGVQLSQANKDSLAQIQMNSLIQTKKVSQDQLAQIITDVAFEKLVSFSDANISSMSDSLCGCSDPNLPPDFKRDIVKLRANGEGIMPKTTFVSQLIYARDAEISYRQKGSRFPPLLRQANRMALKNRVLNEVTNRSNYLVAADPNFFNGSSANEMTPLQAILITYSVIADDSLAGNRAELEKQMLDNQQDITNFTGIPYPSPQGHNAYGVNGYSYSTPTDLLFDDATVTRVLNLIKEKSNIQ